VNYCYPIPSGIHSNKNTFQLSPNPTAGELTINFDPFESGSSEIVFSNLNGEVLLRKNAAGAVSSFALPNDWQNGVYLVSIHGNNGTVTKKVCLIR